MDPNLRDMLYRVNPYAGPAPVGDARFAGPNPLLTDLVARPYQGPPVSWEDTVLPLRAGTHSQPRDGDGDGVRLEEQRDKVRQLVKKKRDSNSEESEARRAAVLRVMKERDTAQHDKAHLMMQMDLAKRGRGVDPFSVKNYEALSQQIQQANELHQQKIEALRELIASNRLANERSAASNAAGEGLDPTAKYFGVGDLTPAAMAQKRALAGIMSAPGMAQAGPWGAAMAPSVAGMVAGSAAAPGALAGYLDDAARRAIEADVAGRENAVAGAGIENQGKQLAQEQQRNMLQLYQKMMAGAPLTPQESALVMGENYKWTPDVMGRQADAMARAAWFTNQNATEGPTQNAAMPGQVTMPKALSELVQGRAASGKGGAAVENVSRVTSKAGDALNHVFMSIGDRGLQALLAEAVADGDSAGAANVLRMIPGLDPVSGDAIVQAIAGREDVTVAKPENGLLKQIWDANFGKTQQPVNPYDGRPHYFR